MAVDQKILLICICYTFLLPLCEKCPNTEFFCDLYLPVFTQQIAEFQILLRANKKRFLLAH